MEKSGGWHVEKKGLGMWKIHKLEKSVFHTKKMAKYGIRIPGK